MGKNKKKGRELSMAGWDDILKELGQIPSQHDILRRKYLKQLSECTKRNVIAYYSSWLTKPTIEGSDINDSDMTGFMNSIKGMDCSRGLDLILHTPGGSPTAAESIIKYLRAKLSNDIRVIVPHLAMSAGTMMACAGKSIVMGKHSSLGPIDPQFDGIPAYNIKTEFEDAKEELLKDPNTAKYWAIRLEKYPAAFLKLAYDSIKLSDALIVEWLGTCMYDKDNLEDQEVIKRISAGLNEHSKSMNHARHFDINYCKSIGLKIEELEAMPELQDAVLSVHHSYMITLGTTNVLKIIESQNEKAYIMHVNVN